jgi:hypothetical protein
MAQNGRERLCQGSFQHVQGAGFGTARQLVPRESEHNRKITPILE